MLVKAWYISSECTSIKENEELMKNKNKDFFSKKRNSINISNLSFAVKRDYDSWINEVEHSPSKSLDKAREKIEALHTHVYYNKGIRDNYKSNDIRLRKCVLLYLLIEQLPPQINPQPRKQEHLTLTRGISQII